MKLPTLWFLKFITTFLKLLDLGGSAAQSVILMGFVISLTVVQFKYIERKVHY